MTSALDFRHVDVFADVSCTGNGLIVLFGSTARARAGALITVTAEMRQSELILVDGHPETGRVPARIFTAEKSRLSVRAVPGTTRARWRT